MRRRRCENASRTNASVRTATPAAGLPARSSARTVNFTRSFDATQLSGLMPSTMPAGHSVTRADEVSVSPLGSRYSSSARSSCGTSAAAGAATVVRAPPDASSFSGISLPRNVEAGRPDSSTRSGSAKVNAPAWA